ASRGPAGRRSLWPHAGTAQAIVYNHTVTRTLAITEARRLLPQLVDRIAREGGRVDVTRRGAPTVSIVRTEDLERDGTAPLDIAEAAKVELLVEPEDLVTAIRELRSRVGTARRPPMGQAVPRRRKTSTRACSTTTRSSAGR
ncbi:MAG: type II toxin-antitoxin system Phd/YefM family antitoxin, partial [Polyangiaceae bacterium]|nr:type II toxin-antitoxin system Phd/YefM family antitoxin [Polyangiaceae bacterium]